MRLQKLFAITTALTVALWAAPPVKPPATLAHSCSPGGGSCYEGPVDFVGANLPGDVDVVVDGVNNGAYRARKGDLTFTLQFLLGDTPDNTHVVEIYDGGGKNAGALLASTSFTTTALP